MLLDTSGLLCLLHRAEPYHGQAKYYLWDWSLVSEPGARFENLVAGALLKACHS